MRFYIGKSVADDVGFVLGNVLALAFCGWLIRQVWRKPARWGLGVGVSLSLLICCHVFLWHLGTTNPAFAKLDLDRRVLSLVIAELPMMTVAVCCFLMSWWCPQESADGSVRSA